MVQKRILHWVYCGNVGKFRSLGHVASFILGVSINASFFGGPIKELHHQKEKKDVSTNYYFMLVLISERAHSQFFVFHSQKETFD
jgi:hypothetical protein